MYGERFVRANSELAQALGKALTAGSPSGAALQPEDLEPALVEELFRLQPLFQLISTKQATARVHEITRRTAHGRAAFEGEMVDNRAGATQGSYDRPTVTLKVLHYWGSVSGMQQAASRRFIDSLAAEQQAGLEAVSNQFEFGVLWGHTGDGYNFSGLDQLVSTNVINHAGVVTLKLLDDLIDSCTSFRGVRADPGIFLMTPKMKSKITGLQTLARRDIQTVEFEGGLRMETFRNYPILETDYVGGAAISPAGFATSLIAGGALAAGLWRYRIASVRETGETTATASDTETTAAGNLQVTLAWTADPDALLYKVYRSDVGGGVGTEYLLTTISAKTRDADGKITGNVNTWNDDGSSVRPTGALSEVPKETTAGVFDEDVFFLNLNPDRGAAVVGLVDSLGSPVSNLLSLIPLATTRSSFDFMYESFLALQVPWEKLHGHARRVRIA